MLDIPENIKREIQDEAYEIDDIGMSKSNIMLFADKVLKVQENSDEVLSDDEIVEFYCAICNQAERRKKYHCRTGYKRYLRP